MEMALQTGDALLEGYSWMGLGLLALSGEEFETAVSCMEKALPLFQRSEEFTTEAGTLINPSNLRQRSLALLLNKAGLPHIRFHDLKHTCATLLLSKGVHPKFVQELLGHATIAITLDTYSHVLPGMGDQTATAMDEILR